MYIFTVKIRPTDSFFRINLYFMKQIRRRLLDNFLSVIVNGLFYSSLVLSYFYGIELLNSLTAITPNYDHVESYGYSFAIALPITLLLYWAKSSFVKRFLKRIDKTVEE